MEVVYKPVGGAPRLVGVARLEDLLPGPLDAFVLEDDPELTVVYSARPEWRRKPANCLFGDTIVHGPLAVVGRRGSRFESLPMKDRPLAFAVLSQSDATASEDAQLVVRVRDESAAQYAELIAEQARNGQAAGLAEDAFRAGWSALAIHAKEIVEELIAADRPPGEILGHVYIALLYLSQHQNSSGEPHLDPESRR
ncbi:MAG: hypothetical protein ACLPYS_13305 [Vulcanimicrobiaceae bacterium]